MRINNKINKESLDQTHKRILHIIYIWSEEGLIQLYNNKIYGVKIKDVPVVNTFINAFPVTIDGSELIKDHDELFQVFPESHVEHISREIYTLTENSLIKCVFDYSNGILKDSYFLLPANSDVHKSPFKNELLHLLSMK